MHLRSLSLINYKNIVQADIDFSPKINCFIGVNGAGKTNVLDAIYYLSHCKSHSNSIDSQNIFHEGDFFVIQGNYLRNEQDEHIYCGLKRKQKKQFKRNKKEYDRLSEHIGLLPLVMVSPSDNELINGGSDERRRFIDSIISQYDKAYLDVLIRYNNALQQRNALLKSHTTDASLYEIWEEQMAIYGNEIYQKRLLFMNEFLPIFREYHKLLSLENEEVGLRYESSMQSGDAIQQLAASRERDRLFGFSSKGTHKDDLEITLGDFPIKRVGSQGQNKTCLVALKLAQFDFLKKHGKITPILLFDDIFDKLDTFRVEQIIALVSEEHFGQIFITDTNRRHLDEILAKISQQIRIFSVENGIVRIDNLTIDN